MSRQSAKTAKRSTKNARRTVKKGAKTMAKNARAADKKAAKSARNPVGKSTQTKSSRNGRAALMSASILASRSASRPASKSVPKMIRTSSPPVQPVATHEISIKSHRYQVGEMVYYTSPTFGRAAASGSYTVVKLLPSEGDDYQYRIKSSGEAFERVAKESQLDRA
jgi:hypothetical protein